jgi:hypothetical protein
MWSAARGSTGDGRDLPGRRWKVSGRGNDGRVVCCRLGWVGLGWVDLITSTVAKFSPRVLRPSFPRVVSSACDSERLR